ncbi:DUF4167 domain-containing protein [Acidomonas methanolica]|uniref:DUF4167 domain-containing protein n=1 Tax=Acidomonas methanolica TaxID=437 RepID=UPI0005AA9471|nr:DUF4167 domain-containing protein [Acidomonas methanolica]MBU2653206.1 DUF4167 domain-containing protein [Acidomonas methanolica]TCS32155.1 uncharacterized protein DUF4167 [Acidomonas methanolica]
MNMKRMRSRHHRSGGGGAVRHNNGQTPLNRNHVFDSNGPDLRVRGTAQQLFEKYLQLGRDATGTGDRILAEAYFQHAEHYFRILNAMNQAAQQNQIERQERQAQRQRNWTEQPEERRASARDGEEGEGEEDGEDDAEEETAVASEASAD